MPKLRVITKTPPEPHGEPEQQVAQLRDYLLQLCEELAYVLTHLEADNINDSTFQRIQEMIPKAYTGLPPMDGAASSGSSSAWSRGDHRHPHDDSKADAADLTAHVGDTANPHEVTAAQTGAAEKIEGILYTTCDTAASTQTKAITITGITALTAGLQIRVLFTYQQSYNGVPKLNLNGLGAANIQRASGTDAARYEWNAGEVLDLVYNGTAWVLTDGVRADTTYYGITKLNSAVNSTSNATAATAGAVKKAYDLAAAAIPGTQKGAANGVAELDANGMVPSAQLPSYVDDVLEYASKSAFPSTGESGKIYVALDTNLTYRWSGSAYVEISPSLALGETSSTAYRGDRGKTAYDHSQVVSGNPHHVTAAEVGARPDTWTPSAYDVGAQPSITASGILKGDGNGGVSAATAGTDYQTPLAAGTDYQTPLVADVDYQTPLVADVDYQTPLVAGTDYQTPLAAGTDYQTPLVAGTDYQTPLAAGTDYATPAMIPTVPDPSDATPQDLGTADAGVSDDYSRADHIHNMPDADDIGYDNTVSGLSATDVQAALDELASGGGGGGPSPATAAPVMDGSGAVGTSLLYAREDHEHPSDTAKQDAITASGILKGDGAGNVSAAVAGTDYQAPLVAGTDYQTPLAAGTDYQTPLVAGTDYQTPLAAGTDYQTPLVAGTDYQTPLVAGTDYATPGMIPSVPSPSDSTPQDLGTAAAGSSGNYSRADHVHQKPTYSKSDVGLGNVANVLQYSANNPPPYPVTSVNGSTGAVTVSVPSAYTSNPAMDGTASPGSSGSWAKGDHVHPSDTSRVPVYGMGENLFRNWYFVGGGTGTGVFPVNQRGLTSYTANGYTIDGWAFSANGYTQTLLASGLQLTGNRHQYYLLNQRISDACAGKTVTIAIWSSYGLDKRTLVVADGNGYALGDHFSLDISINTASHYTYLGIKSAESTGTSLNIVFYAVGLYLGTEQTLCHNEGTDANPVWVLNDVPDYEYELFRCMTSTADSADTYANKTLANEQELAKVLHDPAGQNVAVGEYAIYNGQLYTANTAITSSMAASTFASYLTAVPGGGLNNVGFIDISSYISVNQSRLNNAKIKARYYPGSKKVELQAEGTIATTLSAAQNTLFLAALQYAPVNGVQQFTGCGIKNSQTPVAVWADSASINVQHGGTSVGDKIAISLSWLLLA